MNKVRAPKWVGVIGFIFCFFCLPLEADGAEFVRNAAAYLLLCLPFGLFCLYISGGFDKIIDEIKNH